MSARRNFLAGAAAAAVATPAVVEAMADPHVEWHREWRALVDWWNTADGDHTKDSNTHPAWLRLLELEDLIADTPATTQAGMLCQVDVALHNCAEGQPGNELESIEGRVLVSLRAALEGRTAA
jgi:hypothetical protein